MASRRARDTPPDGNETQENEEEFDISILQSTRQTVRKGSVMLSRAQTVTAYQKQRQGFPRPNLSGDADDMCALQDWPSHARRNLAQIRNETNGQRKYGRGVLKGYKVTKKRFANGASKLGIEFSDKLGGSIGINYRSFVDDVVMFMKRRARLIRVRKWSDINSTIQELIVADVAERWDLEHTQDIQEKILKIAKERYRGWRSTLHSTYKAYNTDAARMANVPEEVKPEEWEWLIEYFGTDAKFQEISRKNSDNRKNRKAKHRVGSKSYAQLSYEKRDPETGEEPDSIQLWELTHTKSGVWSNSDSQAIYDNACNNITQKEGELEGPVTREERNTIFQSTYKTTMGCKSSQPRGYGYMAKPPSGADRIRVALDEQARETERRNVDLINQLAAERELMENELARERAEREIEREKERAEIEKEREEERAERERLLAEEHKTRKVELQSLEETLLAKMAQIMASKQNSAQEIAQTRNGFTPSANPNAGQPLFPNVRSTGALGGKSQTISTHQLMQAAKIRPRLDKDGMI